MKQTTERFQGATTLTATGLAPGRFNRSFALLASVLASVLFLGCPAEKKCDETVEDCSTPVDLPDVCNSREEALAGGQCALTPGQAKEAYISFSGDQDWYLAQLPDGLDGRSLLHVTGGYNAPNTAVNLSLNVLREDGQSSIVRQIDKHGQGAPRPVNIVMPFAESNAKLLVLVGDEAATSRPNFDVKSPYNLMFEVVQNPDANEPNDTTATAIPIAAVAGVPQGQATGYLATDNDVDKFSFTAPGGGRKILYLRVTAPALSPPAAYRLSYTLLDPSGNPISEDVVANEFLPVDLPTARVSTPGNYTLVLKGYRSVNVTGNIPGDLRLQYTVQVKFFDEQDLNESNDTQATATVIALNSAGQSGSRTGRLASVPDMDWYRLDLGSTGAKTVLSYKVTPTTTGGRFPPLAAVADRQVRLVTRVTGPTLADAQLDCRTKPQVCPKGYLTDADPSKGLVDALCNSDGGTGALCLWSERNEHPEFASVRNLEGRIPVPAGGATYYLVVQDVGNDYADDLDYVLNVQRIADADDNGRGTDADGGEGTTSVALTATGAYPAPGAGSEVTGRLSHGHGTIRAHDPNKGQGVRGPQDYDAVPTDYDRYEVTIPGGVTTEQAWALQWELTNDNGSNAPPADLFLELEFCETDGGTSACRSLGPAKTLAYVPDRISPWYDNAFLARDVQWSKSSSGLGPAGTTTFTAASYACLCYETRFIQGTKYFVKVGATDRNNYNELQYKLRQGYTAYPQNRDRDGGSAGPCPTPCRLTGLP